MAHSPPGHHSVMGQPRAGGLNYPEYVIYRGEQVSGPSIIFYPYSNCEFYINCSHYSFHKIFVN